MQAPPTGTSVFPLGKSADELRAIEREEVALKREVEARARAEARRRTLAINAGRLALFLAVMFLWWFASGRWVDRLFFSDPIAIWNEFFKLLANGQLLYHMQFTVTEVLAGYAWGVGLGLLAAFLLSQMPSVHQMVEPFLVMFYAIPRVALAPLIIMWFGIGITSKIVLAATLVFFIVFMNTVTGIRNVSPQLISVARMMGASRWQLLTKIVLWAALPYILTALRVTVPSAMIGAIIGEFISSNRGIGYLVSAASSQYNTAGVFAGIFALLIVVAVLDVSVAALEAYLLRWRPKVQVGHEQV
jgi:NitT/TauT family transport system permease protein